MEIPGLGICHNNQVEQLLVQLFSILNAENISHDKNELHLFLKPHHLNIQQSIYRNYYWIQALIKAMFVVYGLFLV